MSAKSIKKRGRCPGLVAPFIARSSPVRIHATTLSTEMPQRRASCGGVIFWQTTDSPRRWPDMLPLLVATERFSVLADVVDATYTHAPTAAKVTVGVLGQPQETPQEVGFSDGAGKPVSNHLRVRKRGENVSVWFSRHGALCVGRLPSQSRKHTERGASSWQAFRCPKQAAYKYAVMNEGRGASPREWRA